VVVHFFDVSKAIIINGGFQTPSGTELELITQPCPDNKIKKHFNQ